MPDEVKALTPFLEKNILGFGTGTVESRGSLQVKSHSEKDVWDQVRETEHRYGDQAETRLAQRIHELTAQERFEEVSFWSAVAARLKDLHDIKLPDTTILPMLLNTTDWGRTP